MPVNNGNPTTDSGTTNCWFCTAAACCNLLLGNDSHQSGTVAANLGIEQTSDAFAARFAPMNSGVQSGMSIEAAIAASASATPADAVGAQVEQIQKYVRKHTGHTSIVKRSDYDTLEKLMTILSDRAVYAFYFGALGYTPGHWICARMVNNRLVFMDYQQDSAAQPGMTPSDGPTVDGKSVPGNTVQNAVLVGFRTN